MAGLSNKRPSARTAVLFLGVCPPKTGRPPGRIRGGLFLFLKGSACDAQSNDRYSSLITLVLFCGFAAPNITRRCAGGTLSVFQQIICWRFAPRFSNAPRVALR